MCEGGVVFVEQCLLVSGVVVVSFGGSTVAVLFCSRFLCVFNAISIVVF